MSDAPARPRLYDSLASWWPLLSPPSHYDGEAADLLPLLLETTQPRPRTLLELGSGGGSLAWHLKRQLELTLTDRAPAMLAISRAVNPECEHIDGDMYTLRLGRLFDAVLIHDAIMYALDERDMRRALETARVHCRPGGVLVMVPDCVRETFEPATETGGEDGADGRALRYLQWTWDPDLSDTTCEVAFAFLLREVDGSVRVELDRHRFGIFPRTSWIAWLEDAGFTARTVRDSYGRDVFVGVRHGLRLANDTPS